MDTIREQIKEGIKDLHKAVAQDSSNLIKRALKIIDYLLECISTFKDLACTNNADLNRLKMENTGLKGECYNKTNLNYDLILENLSLHEKVVYLTATLKKIEALTDNQNETHAGIWQQCFEANNKLKIKTPNNE